MILIRKANWQRRECNGCKEYSPECRHSTTGSFESKKVQRVYGE